LRVAPSRRAAPLLASLVAFAQPQVASSAPPAGAPPADETAPKPKKSAAPDEKWAIPGWPAMRFSEVARASGIDCTNLSGHPEKPRLIDTLGVGVCWFDYDGDGWLDLFLPNGSTLEAVLGKPVETKKSDGSVALVPARNEVSDRLFRNRGDGTFEDVTDRAGLRDDRWGISAAAGDYDNDGDDDLFVCNFGPCFLYRNDGDGTFTDVAKEAGVQFGNVTPGAAWGDVDQDGDLDLYVSAYLEFDPAIPWPAFAKTMRGMKVMMGPQGLLGAADRLYRNNGDGTFSDASKEAGLRTTEEEYGFTVQILDFSGDDLPDIFVADDQTVNHFYRAVKPGKFKPAGSDSGLSVDRNGDMKACMGVAIADLNDDRIPDLFITNFSAQTNDLYVSQGDCQWEEDASPTERAHRSTPDVGWGTGFYDFDLDGDEDLILFNGHVFPQVEAEKPKVQEYYQYPMLYRRDGPLRFSNAAEAAGPDFYVKRCCRGAGFADYDEDGDVDVLVCQIDGPALLLRNDAERGIARPGPDGKPQELVPHFLKVQLLGTTINRNAYGSRIVIEAGGRAHARWVLGQGSFISQNDARAHVGLGLVDQVDRIVVRWAGGKEEVVEGPLAVDRTLVIKEGMGKVGEMLPARAGEDGTKLPAQVWTRAMSAALAPQ
jgi:hypothetical protein